MAIGAYVRWLAFIIYLGMFLALPLGILWGTVGLSVAVAGTLGLAALIGYRGTERIARRLGVRELSRAEDPYLFNLVREYCRRMRVPEPRLAVMDSQAVNAARFGFSTANQYVVLTTGALRTLPRSSLAALVGRQLVALERGDVFCESWLSQFLATVDSLIVPVRPRIASPTPRYYPFQLFLRQAVIYPLLLFPGWLLQSRRPPEEVDARSLKVTGQPRGLAESMRQLQALAERIPFQVPFSTRHLFLLPPQPQDPLGRIFFGEPDLNDRIRRIEGLKKLRPLVPEPAGA